MYIMYIHEVHSEQSLNLIVTSVAIYITLRYVTQFTMHRIVNRIHKQAREVAGSTPDRALLGQVVNTLVPLSQSCIIL